MTHVAHSYLTLYVAVAHAKPDPAKKNYNILKQVDAKKKWQIVMGA